MLGTCWHWELSQRLALLVSARRLALQAEHKEGMEQNLPFEQTSARLCAALIQRQVSGRLLVTRTGLDCLTAQ